MDVHNVLPVKERHGVRLNKDFERLQVVRKASGISRLLLRCASQHPLGRLYIRSHGAEIVVWSKVAAQNCV